MNLIDSYSSRSSGFLKSKNLSDSAGRNSLCNKMIILFLFPFQFYIMLISIYALALAVSYVFSCADKEWKGSYALLSHTLQGMWT